MERGHPYSSAGPRPFPSMLRRTFPEKHRHSIPVNRQPSVSLSSSDKKASLRASGARAERLFFVCGDPGYFPRNPRLCFLLEFVADLEYAIYAFPFPRITGGAKQKRDRVLF